MRAPGGAETTTPSLVTLAPVMIKGRGVRWLGTVLAVSSVLVSGCAYSADPDDLPGRYRDDKSGGEITLGTDGTFSATSLSTEPSEEPSDFRGRWEFVDSSASDFVYLTVDDLGPGKANGIQLYPTGEGTVEFRVPDDPWFLELSKQTAP
ncbi:hypothetical protein GCM10019017_21510 [Streptomyces showdoensis]